MIKVTKDFLYELQQANQKKDRQAQSDLLIPKIADLINNDRDEVIVLLKDSGIKVPDNVSRKQLAILVADNAGIRPKVADGLSFMIARNNGIELESEGVSNFFGELIGAISAPITSIFNAKAAGEQTKAIEDTNRTALLLAVLKQQNAGPSTTTYVIGGLLVLTAAAVIYFAFIRKKE